VDEEIGKVLKALENIGSRREFSHYHYVGPWEEFNDNKKELLGPWKQFYSLANSCSAGNPLARQGKSRHLSIRPATMTFVLRFMKDALGCNSDFFRVFGQAVISLMKKSAPI